MTDAQKRFCDEYLIDLNATRAYKVAYPRCKKDETANAASSRMLRNVKVQEYISEKQQEIEKRTEITQDKVIKELANIAFFNIRNIYNNNGTLKAIKDIDEETIRAISSVKVLQKKLGHSKIETTLNTYASVLARFEGQEDDKLNFYLENIGIKV